MRDFARKIAHWLALETEEGAAAVEYAVIAGVVIGGLLGTIGVGADLRHQGQRQCARRAH